MASASSYVSGNLGQAQLQAMVNLSKSTKKSGYDVLGSAFRMWLRPIPDEPLLRIGDTAAVTALPFWYLGDKPFVLGTVRYEHSQLRGISVASTGRGIWRGPCPAGANCCVSPWAPRWSAPAAYPTCPPTGSTTPPPGCTEGHAPVQRLDAPAGHAAQRPVRGRAARQPHQGRRHRWFLDASADVKIARQWAFRLAFNGLHDAVNPTGVLPTDLRTTAGFAWSTQPPGKSPADMKRLGL